MKPSATGIGLLRYDAEHAFRGLDISRMKKMKWLGALLAGMATVAMAQESRQDVSLSATGLFAPRVDGNGAHLITDSALGALASYRYMLTPRSALEANYSFAQYNDSLNNSAKQYQIHTRQQEISLGYVYSRNYRRLNPFLEGGVAGVVFSPIKDNATQSVDAKRTTSLGGMFGGGVAYELSPSFDIRLQYHGVVVKAPSFGVEGSNFSTNRYEVISMPALGIAYHF